MSEVISTPRNRANSHTSTPAAAALGRIMQASATGSSQGWWSMIARMRARRMTASPWLRRAGTETSTLTNRSGEPTNELAGTRFSEHGRYE